jgi:hypothetical protein
MSHAPEVQRVRVVSHPPSADHNKVGLLGVRGGEELRTRIAVEQHLPNGHVCRAGRCAPVVEEVARFGAQHIELLVRDFRKRRLPGGRHDELPACREGQTNRPPQSRLTTDRSVRAHHDPHPTPFTR